MPTKNTKISFHFHPSDIEHKNHAIEKSDDAGQKNKYLLGVSSGSKIDQNGERITEKCIKSFIDQSNSGMVLLYPDVHSIRQSEDIGILTKAEIKPDGNWHTEYRLYRPDECGAAKQEKIETIWKQVNGIAPYTRPIQKGFSIEGYIPEDGVVSAEKDETSGAMRNRVIDKISLDGVVLVPRPAYQDSIAHAVYKALGEMTPETEMKTRMIIKNRFGERIEKSEMQDGYYRKKWEIQDALENEIEMIMKSNRHDKGHRLNVLFQEHAEVMNNLIMKSESLFVDEKHDDKSPTSTTAGKLPRVEILKALAVQLGRLKSYYAR